jgi:hypothetical protein
MFLRISADEYINTEEISHIKVLDPMTCLLTTESGIYTAGMPVETLLAIIKNDEPKGEQATLESIDNKIGNLPIFAG